MLTGLVRSDIMDQGFNAMKTGERLSARVTVNEQGRVVIPAALRQALAIRPGDVMIARVQDDGLLLERLESVEKRVLSWFAAIPADVSLADELIAERREEARRESEETAEWLQAHRQA